MIDVYIRWPGILYFWCFCLLDFLWFQSPKVRHKHLSKISLQIDPNQANYDVMYTLYFLEIKRHKSFDNEQDDEGVQVKTKFDWKQGKLIYEII